jgi:hypothetical protein
MGTLIPPLTSISLVPPFSRRSPCVRHWCLTIAERVDGQQAELAEIELVKKRGEVLDRDEVRDTWRQYILAVRQTMLGLPARIAFDVPTLSAHDRETMKETCRTALWDLVLGRGFAVLGPDSGERCDACGGVIPVLGDNEEMRRKNESAVYPDEREKVLGTRSGETKTRLKNEDHDP